MAPPHLALLLLIAVVLGAALGIGAVWLRRMSVLGHRPGTFRCRVGSSVDGPWRSGLAQYSADRLSWWPRFSLGGAEHWERDCLTVLSRGDALVMDAAGNPLLVLTCRVTRTGGDRHDLFLLLGAAASAGLTSWLEATPPARHRVI